MDITNSKKAHAILDELETLLNQSPPRTIPKSLLFAARNRFLKSLMLLLGAAVFVFFPAMFTLQAVVHKTVNFGPGVYPAYVLMLIFLIVFLWALMTYRSMSTILTHGRQYSATINKIRNLPLRMASTTYHLVSVTLNDNLGFTRNVYDMVDNFAFDYYYKAYANNEPVNIIYAPEVPRYGILTMKLPYQSML